MAQELSSFCASHPAERATGKCDHCGKTYCDSCLVEDVAGEKAFCSKDCRNSWRSKANRGGLVDNHELLAAYATPIRSGWKLWLRSIPQLTLYTAPPAVAMSWVLLLPTFETVDEMGEPTISDAGGLILLAVGAFGIALTQVVMTQRHSGLVEADPYWLTVKRFFPWAAALVLEMALVILGMFALIIPGVYLSLRLFWAEEFALVHGMGPLAGLRESWKLTEGSAGAIFLFQTLAGLAAYVVLLGVFAVGAILVSSAGFIPDGSLENVVGALFSAAIFWLLFVAYAGIHAPEIVYLYGMRAERAVGIAESSKTLGI